MKKTKKKYKFNIMKLLENLFYLFVIGITVYAVYNRIQDINNIDFFFTTWK